MYATYCIKITRRNGEIEYVKHTWPDCTVTSVPTEAFEFHYRDSAEWWVEGKDGCAIEEVYHMEYADVVAWVVQDHNDHCDDGISAEQVTPQFALDYLLDCYNDGGYDDSRPRRGDNAALDLMLGVARAYVEASRIYA